MNWNAHVLIGNLQDSMSIVTFFTELPKIQHKLFNSVNFIKRVKVATSL